MQELGLAYWGVTDHSKSSVQANGLSAARVREELAEVRRINKQLENEGTEFRLLIGTEVDILTDGSLDFPDDLLAELDVVIASVHQSFSQSEAELRRDSFEPRAILMCTYWDTLPGVCCLNEKLTRLTTGQLLTRAPKNWHVDRA